jgi:hypothetical protein
MLFRKIHPEEIIQTEVELKPNWEKLKPIQNYLG